MAKNETDESSLADPSRLSSLGGDKQVVKVVIETPKGSRNKYVFDTEEKVFELKRVLPAGMAFPYDFGFVPSTRAADGNPVDVLVLMDEPAFTGCVLRCRLIGIIEGEQWNEKRKVRNDRVVAIEKDNHSFAEIKHIGGLGKQFLRELEEFFVNYHDLSDEKYRIIGAKGPAHARKRIADGRREGHRK